MPSSAPPPVHPHVLRWLRDATSSETDHTPSYVVGRFGQTLTVKGVAEQLRDAGYHIGHTYKTHIRIDLIGGKASLYNDAGRAFNNFSQNVSQAKDQAAARKKIFDQVRNNFKAFLAKRKPVQPLYYSIHPTNTHRKREKGSGKALWGLNPDTLKGRLEPFCQTSREVRGFCGLPRRSHGL